MHLSKKLFLDLLLAGFILASATSAASAQTLSIVSGDGQVAVQNNQAINQMIVVVRNFSGQPVVGTTVTWTLNGQGSLLFGSTTTTDVNGYGYNQFLGGTLFGVSFTQSIITATAFGSSVNFTQTTSGQDPVSLLVFVQANVNYPGLGQVLSGSAGSIGTTPVQVQVNSVGPSGAQGVPNVLIHLYPSGTTLSASAAPVLPSGPQIACAGSSGYTNSSGVANCLPVFSGSTGSSSYTIDVGGAFRTFGPFGFSVTQSSVATFRITGGNNQSGAPGTPLPLPLTAQAEDINGNPLPSVPVMWSVLTPNAATITASSSASDSNGNVSASVTLGSTVGFVQIQLSSSSGGSPAVFSVQVTQQVTGVTKSAGDQQTAIVNSTFAQPLVVQVNTSQGPAAGVQVNFSGANVAFPQGATVATGTNGQASIVVQAGSTAGTATVTATAGNFSATFTLTIALPGPQITTSSFFNAAGGLSEPGGVSPSALVEIAGAGIATGLQGCVNGATDVGPLQLLVSSVTVEFIEGSYQQYGPIYAVCNAGGQQYVIVQVPTDLPLGAASVTVNAPSGSKTVNNVPVTPVSPGVFQTVMTDKVQRAVLQHVSDGSFVELENPAHAGETLRAFVTGLGRPISKSGTAIATNEAGILGDDAAPQNPILVGVGNEGANVISVVYSQDQVGVYIVTFQVPTDAQPGNTLLPNVPFGVAAVLNGTPQFGNPSSIPIF